MRFFSFARTQIILRPLMADAFSYPVYYLHARHQAAGRKRWHKYGFYTPDGRSVLAADVHGIPKDIVIADPAKEHQPLLLLKAKPFFVFNGKYNVLEFSSRRRLGAVKRNGAIFDGHGERVGTVAEGRRLRTRLGQGLLVGVLDAVLADGNSNTAVPRADSFDLIIGSQRAGMFRSTKLPFMIEEDTDAPSHAIKQILRRIIPARLWPALHAPARPSAWQLEFFPGTAPDLDPRLRLAAALFRIDIERRYGF
jgi:hypothetical protein